MTVALPHMIYLDLNHWYALGDALAGAPQRPDHVAIFNQLRGLVDRGEIAFPLSAVHYMELAENPRDAHRERAADAMALLSRFITMAPEWKILDEELARQLNHQFGRPAFPMKVLKFGVGAGFAFGQAQRMVLEGITEGNRREFESRMGASVSEIEKSANATAEYWVLRGPTAALRSAIPTYDPYAARRIADNQLAELNVMINTLRTVPDVASRPMDAICARQFYFDMEDHYIRALLSAGFTKNRTPFHSKADFTNFLMAPTSPTTRCSWPAARTTSTKPGASNAPAYPETPRRAPGRRPRGGGASHRNGRDVHRSPVSWSRC
ncbi:hypothetical protein OG333_36860 [Streptomyces anulatus]|uniref:hypothetical protein n=1 Tax=Streptomyces anulatus TaxID=1892 RepID=UPI00386F9FB8|nr:hypothetical protein OG333_36860 [Streptomyces anulatus]